MGHEYDIYGNHDDYDDFPSNRHPEPQVRDEFKISWPVGYWEEYDRLKAEARQHARDQAACLVMCMNNKFRVRTTGLVVQDRGYELKYSYGPEMDERLAAWAAFIDSVTTRPTQALKELAGKKLKINLNRVRGVR